MVSTCDNFDKLAKKLGTTAQVDLPVFDTVTHNGKSFAARVGYNSNKQTVKIPRFKYKYTGAGGTKATLTIDNGILNAKQIGIEGADTESCITTFVSDDSSTGSSTAPAVITSGETHKSLFNKISTAVKNVRWLLSKMGTTDISSLGDGTVTGALSTLNSNMNNIILSYPSMDIVSLITNYVTNDNLPLYSLRVFILVSSQGTYQAIICRSNTTWFSGIIIPATSQESNKWVFNAIIGSPGTYSLF